jgi:hypothetical protein
MDVDVTHDTKWPSYVSFDNLAMKKTKGLIYFEMLKEG